MNVLVVGAGIIGSSISRQLASRGVKVTVLEAAPAPAAGATGKSWAWLNANAKKPAEYRDLNLRSMQLWALQHPDLCHLCGCLMLHDERPAGADPAYPSQHIPAGPQLAAFEPGLSPQLAETCQHAKLYAQEGWCDPAAATAAFLQDAQAAGAKVVYSQQVQTLVRDGDRVTAVNSSSSSRQPSQSDKQQQQQQQQFPADVVVLAAGVGTAELCEQLGYRLPLLHKPAAILLTSPLQRGTLQHMVVTDTVFILQRSDGSCLIGETQPTAAANTDTSDSNAARILGLAAAAVPALSGVTVEGMQVGYRPYPADGLPVLGWVPGWSNAYVAVTHSGMTLAPLVGQLVAEELLGAASTPAAATPATTTASNSSSSTPVSANCLTSTATGACGAAAQLLAPYRPDRDFDAAVAAAAAQPGLSWAATLRPGSSRQ